MRTDRPYEIYKSETDNPYLFSAVFFYHAAFTLFIAYQAYQSISLYNRTYWGTFPEAEPNFSGKAAGAFIAQSMIRLSSRSKKGTHGEIKSRAEFYQLFKSEHNEAMTQLNAFQEQLDPGMEVARPYELFLTLTAQFVITLLISHFLPKNNTLSPLQKYRRFGMTDLQQDERRKAKLSGLELRPNQNEFIYCPISHEPMMLPAKVRYLHEGREISNTYDHIALHGWLKSHTTDPKSNVDLRSVQQLTIEPDYERYDLITTALAKKEVTDAIHLTFR